MYCKKKTYATFDIARWFLAYAIAIAKKYPDRNEISIYKCEYCKKYHVSSKPTEWSPVKVRGKGYLDYQKEKMNTFLHKYSSNKGRV